MYQTNSVMGFVLAAVYIIIPKPSLEEMHKLSLPFYRGDDLLNDSFKESYGKYFSGIIRTDTNI